VAAKQTGIGGCLFILHPHNWLIDKDVPGDGLRLGNQENRNVCKKGFLVRRNLAKDRAGEASLRTRCRIAAYTH
jgi:hypothetical protein